MPIHSVYSGHSSLQYLAPSGVPFRGQDGSESKSLNVIGYCGEGKKAVLAMLTTTCR